MKTPLYCSYYQAHVKRSECWFVTAVLKSFEHMSFDRTIDVERSIFEFFVPSDMEQKFLDLMADFTRRGLVSNLQKLPNRLEQGAQEL